MTVVSEAGSGGAIATGLVPLPVLASTDEGASFELSSDTRIVTGPDADGAKVAATLAALLRPSTGFALAVSTSTTEATPADSIVLRLGADDSRLGEEGYELTVSTTGVLLTANRAAGLFRGVQTLRQLLPASIEARGVQPGPWRVTGGRIVDYPRFTYRGAMLDVARHFFTVQQVERYIDQLALVKVNVLHLHLSDDQGWRIAIDSWPELTAHGARTEVGGGEGGYYSKADYTAIVEYAQERYITVVPEIDTPGHTNAALSSYAELNCDGVAPPLYTGTDVGFSSLCVGKPITYQFLDDLVGELAALTPGPYIHLGGDEAKSTSASDYTTFLAKAQAIVEAHGKTFMGWAEISRAELHPQTVAEYWDSNDHGVSAADAARQGVRLVMAPGNRAYLDQKYDSTTTLGLHWAGYVDVRTAYDWDPGDGLPPDTDILGADVLGVEGPLWTETVETPADLEYLAWPRMAGIAEIGWSPRAGRDWESYRTRLAALGPRWTTLGVNFYRSPQVPWAS